MAAIPALLFLALSFSMGSLLISEPLITFANQNHNNFLISLAVPTFLFFLLPLTFISAIVLLILHVAIPQSAYTRRLTVATKALTFTALFLGAVLMMPLTFTSTAKPDAIEAAVVVAALVIVHISFAESFNLPNYLANGFVPVFLALCISTGTLLLADQVFSLPYHDDDNSLSNILIRLLLFCNFNLATVLLFLRASAALVGPRHLISAVMIERLVKMTVATSFTTALIGMYMMVIIGWN